MSLEEYAKEKLWPTLVETAHTLVMFPSHKAYTREHIITEKPEISPVELASRLGISMGEALVILYELTSERKMQP
jgi:ribosomal protein S25